MSFLDIFKPKELICPRCESAMSSHVDGVCPKRKLSRRFFLGAIGTAASIALAQVMPNVVVDEAVGDNLVCVAAPMVHKFGAIHFEGNESGFLAPTFSELQRIADTRRLTVSYRNGTEMMFAEPLAIRDAKSGRLAFGA